MPKKITLTKNEIDALYELLAWYLYKDHNHTIGILGISPDGYVGLIRFWERMTNKKEKTDYKKLLKLLCQKK